MHFLRNQQISRAYCSYQCRPTKEILYCIWYCKYHPPILPSSLCHNKNICHPIWILYPELLFYQCQYINVKNSNMLHFKISHSAWNVTHEIKKVFPTNLIRTSQTTSFYRNVMLYMYLQRMKWGSTQKDKMTQACPLNSECMAGYYILYSFTVLLLHVTNTRWCQKWLKVCISKFILNSI